MVTDTKAVDGWKAMQALHSDAAQNRQYQLEPVSYVIQWSDLMLYIFI